MFQQRAHAFLDKILTINVPLPTILKAIFVAKVNAKEPIFITLVFMLTLLD